MCLEAWRDLDADRPLGFGVVGQVPYTALRLWARDNRLDFGNFQMLKAVIRQLDNSRTDREASRRALKGRKR